MLIVRHIRISGTVQGVFFRATAKEVADHLGIHGWVFNRNDGSVEIHAEGTEETLKEFLQWCQKGPPMARVEQVTVEETPETQCKGFEIIR